MNVLFGFLLLAIYVVAWYFQSPIILNWDVCWDLIGAERFLNGGNYLHDFFDLNPPFIFYYLMPALFFRDFFSIDLVTALHLYIFVFSIPLLFLSGSILKIFFNNSNKWLFYSLIFSILFAYLIYPVYDFGQREHFLVLLTIPYFLSVAVRMENKPLPLSVSLPIGILAAAGFILKPYFLISPFLVELYFCLKEKNLKTLFRPEMIAIGITLSLGFLFVLFFYPDYLKLVIPLSLKYYHTGFNDSWRRLLFNGLLFLQLLSLVFFIVFYKKIPLRSLAIILFLTMLGNVFSYLLQQTTWVYHAYPSYVFALLLGIFIFFSLINNPRIPSIFYLIGTLILMYPPYHTAYLYDYVKTYDKEHVLLKNFILTHAVNKPIYLLSANGHNLLPTAYYTHSNYTSRFLHLFWVPSIVCQTSKGCSLSKSQIQDEKYFLNSIAEELYTQKPSFVFVDTREYKPFFKMIHFNYIDYLSKNLKFREVWKNYRYLTTLEQFPIKASNLSEWDLYYINDISQLNPSALEKNSAFITGFTDTKKVYYIQNQKFLTNNQELLTLTLHLSNLESSFLSNQKGKISRALNPSLFDKLMTKTINFPTYRFDVYERVES